MRLKGPLERAPPIHLQFTSNSPPNTFSEYKGSVQNYSAWKLLWLVSLFMFAIQWGAIQPSHGEKSSIAKRRTLLQKGELYCEEESSIMEHSIVENIKYTVHDHFWIQRYFAWKLENWAFMTMIQPSTMVLSSLQLRSYLSLLVLERGSNLEQVSISIYYLSPQCRGRWELGGGLLMRTIENIVCQLL